MSTQTISLTDSIYIRRSPTENRTQKEKKPREILIYFIPGNPGVIQYYNHFLTHLASLLDPDTTNSIYHVVGHSLGGFELQSNASGYSQLEAMMTGNAPANGHGRYCPHNLTSELVTVFANIGRTVALLRRTEEAAPLQVVLVGHSVGAYIMMQNLMFRQLEQTSGIDSPLDGTGEIIGAYIDG